MSVAKAYAQALYQAAAEKAGTNSKQVCDKIEVELDQFLSWIDASKDVRTALYGPVVSAKEKTAVIEAIGAKAELSPILIQFLSLLARKGRMALLPEIRD